METPLVSVIVPTYQHGRFIEECLKGVLMQQVSFTVEILIGEDGSTDGTREICERIVAEHPDKVRLFLRDRKDVISIMGRPTGRANLLALLKEARGRYIAWCDGDDVWRDPLKLQKQVDILEGDAGVVVTYHDAILMDEEGVQLAPSKMPDWAKRDLDREELLQGRSFILSLSMVFRNIDLFRAMPFEMTKVGSADNFITSLLAAHGTGRYASEVVPAGYRVHKGGIWSALPKSKRTLSQMNNCMWVGAYYGRIGDHGTADHYLTKAYRMVEKTVQESEQWTALEHRRSYRLFARVLAWFRVSLPR